MSGRDDDSRPDFDLTTPYIKNPRQPSAPQQGSDFDRTAVNMPLPPREGGNRPAPPSGGGGGRNKFDLTSVNFHVPDDEDDIVYRRPPTTPPPQQQVQYVATQQPPQQQAAPPRRLVPTWVWAAGGSFVATLVLILAALALYFFWPFSSTFTLKVLNAPQGSKIFIDEVPVGVSQADGAIIAQGLRSGEMREVRVTHQGYADWRTGVKGTGGEVRELRVKLTPLTEAPPPPVEDQIDKDLEEMGRARIYGINFDPDSDRLKDDSKPTLSRIVNILKKRTALRLTIEGHTDSTSTPEHNKDLSERRAQAVKAFLQSNGIDGARLTTVGYGASKPVADNDTPAGRATNRRVELMKQ